MKKFQIGFRSNKEFQDGFEAPGGTEKILWNIVKYWEQH